jgi:hypothetical protein
MYIFWISVPGIFSEYNAQNDFTFTQLLPVSKSDIVKSKILAFATLELLHILGGIIFAIINNRIFGKAKFLFDLNFAFFGNILIMYAIFNVFFFTRYFKTAYFFGKPLIIAVAFAITYEISIEILNILVKPLNLILESPNNILYQIGICAFGILFFIVTLLYTIKKSIVRFENR